MYLLTLLTHSFTHSSSTQTGLHVNHVSLAQFNHDIQKCPQYQNPVSRVHAASSEHTDIDRHNNLLGAPHSCEHKEK